MPLNAYPTKPSLTVFASLWVILIWTHFLFGATICQAEHFIKFSNSDEEKALLIDGTKDGIWVNDLPLSVPAREKKVSIGNFTPTGRDDGQIIAFTKGHVPVLKEHIEWKAKPDTVRIDFPNPIEIELAIWIITTPENSRGQRVDYESRKNTILNFDCSQADKIWSREAHGLSIKCSPKNRTQDNVRITLADHGVQNANSFFSETPFNCERHADLVKQVGHKQTAINVYYVRLVDADRKELSRAVWCDAFPDIIAIGVSAVDETLAHELGHAFSLDHINEWAPTGCDNTGSNPPCLFDEDNLMYGGGYGRKYLTEGQVFRAFFNDASALNSIYKVGSGRTGRPGEPALFCETILKNEDDQNKCPAIEKRLWSDGTTQPAR